MRIVRSTLKAVRALHSRAVGALVAHLPVLEPVFISAGRRMAASSHLLGTVYWYAQDDLVRRLRESGNRFRRLRVAGLDEIGRASCRERVSMSLDAGLASRRAGW